MKSLLHLELDLDKAEGKDLDLDKAECKSLAKCFASFAQTAKTMQTQRRTEPEK